MVTKEAPYIMPGYEEAAKYPIYYVTAFELLRGYLCGATPEEVIRTYKTIHACTCGNHSPKAAETECMGDFDFTIECPQCGRKLTRSMYDFDVHKEGEYIDLCIRDWNNGLIQSDIEKAKEREEKRISLTADELDWKPLYPNNMPSNGLEGCYALLFRKDDEDKIQGCKWTISFQREEIQPMLRTADARIESYLLFMHRYFDVQGQLSYPAPTDDTSTDMQDGESTFTRYGVNDRGEFIRSYKTLDEAKRGAAARCDWQGLNRDTIIKL